MILLSILYVVGAILTHFTFEFARIKFPEVFKDVNSFDFQTVVSSVLWPLTVLLMLIGAITGIIMAFYEYYRER